MSKYIICESKDWADEFDYPIFSIFGEKTKRTLLLYNNYLEDEDLTEIYFGTNEYFGFIRKEVVDMIQNAKEITESEIEVFDKYMSYPAAVDIVDRILELLYEKVDDIGNQDLLKKLEELDQRD
jgi:hypothetical protein